MCVCQSSRNALSYPSTSTLKHSHDIAAVTLLTTSSGNSQPKVVTTTQYSRAGSSSRSPIRQSHIFSKCRSRSQTSPHLSKPQESEADATVLDNDSVSAFGNPPSTCTSIPKEQEAKQTEKDETTVQRYSTPSESKSSSLSSHLCGSDGVGYTS